MPICACMQMLLAVVQECQETAKQQQAPAPSPKECAWCGWWRAVGKVPGTMPSLEQAASVAGGTSSSNGTPIISQADLSSGAEAGEQGPGPKLRHCARCMRVHYCCVACQRAHWKGGHKSVCKPPAAAPAAAPQAATPST